MYEVKLILGIISGLLVGIIIGVTGVILGKIFGVSGLIIVCVLTLIALNRVNKIADREFSKLNKRRCVQ